MSRQGFRFALITMLVLGTMLCLPIASRAGENTWTTTGPYGVRFSGLYFDPQSDQVMYATTSWSNVPALYKSIDGGVTWRASSTGIPASYASSFAYNYTLAFDQDDPKIMYLARGDGLYRSSDGGATWERKNPYEGHQTEASGMIASVASVVISPLDGAVLVGAPIEPGNVLGGIFRSFDKGETWERLAGLRGQAVEAFAIAPSAPMIIYAGGNTGLFKSVDGGGTWVSLGDNFGGNPAVTCITVDPHNSQVAYVGIHSAGLFRTADGGTTWQPIGNGINSAVRALVIDPGNQQVLYAAGAYSGVPGVYRSLDNTGSRWEFFDTGMGSSDVLTLALDRRKPQSIFAGSMSGIWKRTMTSEPADFGVSINAGALFTNNPAVELSLTAPAGTTEVMLSNDGGFAGARWEPLQPKRSWSITSFGSAVLPRIVYAKFRTDGVVSGLYQDDIILDTQKPTGTATISAPAPTTVSMQARAVQTQDGPFLVHLPLVSQVGRVRLELRASDDVSGVGEMRIANTTTFTGAEWQPFTPVAEWTVSDPKGPLYVQFRDRAMNISDPIQATNAPSAP